MPMWALIAMQLLSQLPTLIQAAEQAFGDRKGQGARKKDFVLGAVVTGLGAAKQLGAVEFDRPEVNSAIITGAGVLTDALVAGLNAADAWKPAPTAP